MASQDWCSLIDLLRRDGSPAAGLRLLLPLAPGQQEEALEELIAQCREHRIVDAYLPASGALVENISILENIWLPAAWRFGIRLAQVQREARRLAAPLGWTERDLAQLLLKRPGEVGELDRLRVVLMRAAILKPQLVLIDGLWFETKAVDAAPLWEAMEQVFVCPWLIVSPAAPHLPCPDRWQTIEQACSSA